MKTHNSIKSLSANSLIVPRNTRKILTVTLCILLFVSIFTGLLSTPAYTREPSFSASLKEKKKQIQNALNVLKLTNPNEVGDEKKRDSLQFMLNHDLILKKAANAWEMVDAMGAAYPKDQHYIDYIHGDLAGAIFIREDFLNPNDPNLPRDPNLPGRDLVFNDILDLLDSTKITYDEFYSLIRMAETLLHEYVHSQQTYDENVADNYYFKKCLENIIELVAYWTGIVYKLELKRQLLSKLTDPTKITDDMRARLDAIDQLVLGALNNIEKLRKFDNSTKLKSYEGVRDYTGLKTTARYAISDPAKPCGAILTGEDTEPESMTTAASRAILAQQELDYWTARLQRRAAIITDSTEEKKGDTISPNKGGTIALPSAAGYIVIPPDSLPNTTEIEISRLNLTGLIIGENALSSVFELSPQIALDPAKPMRLYIRIDNPALIKNANIYWWDPYLYRMTAVGWQEILDGRELDEQHGVISVEIHQFGYYVVILPSPPLGPKMSTLQFNFYNSQSSLFSALLNRDIDIMGGSLTKAQYTSLSNNPNICVSPLPGASVYELAFNSNYTNSAHPNGRSAMNYTDFRQAMAHLVDKAGVIAGPTLQGFATRVDTEIPSPLMAGYINPSVSYPNYPWEFNVTKALDILYTGGWYSHIVYPTFADLLSAYTNGALATAGGTTNGVVYPSVDPNGQWGGTDTYVNMRNGQPIDTLQGYVRSNDARKDLGDFFCNQLRAIGVPFVETYCASLTILRPFVMENNNPYDFATLGYIMSSPPNWWYSELTPAGIYSDGDNPYLVDDANMTHYAYACYTDTNQTQYMNDLMAVQDILVNEAYLVSVYSPASYCAYKTGLLGMTNELGYGYQGSCQLLNWVTMHCKKNNTISYTGDPASTPDSNKIYYGTIGSPDMVNPIFSELNKDFQVLDEIFTYPLATNPYNTMVTGSALTGAPTGGDLPWMAYAWKTELIPNPTGGTGQWTNVTLWFRNDITWHDGVPFTVADVNYTIYVNALYGDSSYNYATRLMTNDSNGYAPYFTEWDPYTCSILVNSSNWLSLYLPNLEIVPEHLYKYIVPSNIALAEEGFSTDGLHGIWPGQAATADNILPGAPFTLSDLQNKPETTLVGTGPWMYRPGSTDATLLTSPNGSITLDAYHNFFMKIAPGAIDFKYTWLNTSPSAQPSGGYYKIGLTDLVLLANAYGTTGTPPSTVPISGNPGDPHTWNPGADLAAPSGFIGLSDLVTMALHYGWYWGNYSYNAPYPPSEIANGGP
jgi:ABC-type transport system substrate-binding protein